METQELSEAPSSHRQVREGPEGSGLPGEGGLGSTDLGPLIWEGSPHYPQLPLWEGAPPVRGATSPRVSVGTP